jgi:hypothetical protein
VAIFLRHTGCSKCGSSDALANYSDGGTFCFSCGVPSGANAMSFDATRAFEEDEEDLPLLPTDLSHDFPETVINWLQPTGVTIAELIRNGYFYSRFKRGLVRVLRSEAHGREDQLPAKQLRVYPRTSTHEIRVGFYGASQNQEAPRKRTKTIFNGDKDQANGCVQFAGGQTKEVCIVEDSISAIKCGRVVDAIPLFGSSVSNNKLARITRPYEKVYVWLDSNKYDVAVSIADRCKLLGKQSRVICTELDPKYLDFKDYG